MNGEIGRNTTQQWWGNTVFKNTADWHASPLRIVPDGEHFGYVLFLVNPSAVSNAPLDQTHGRSVVVSLDVIVAIICYRAPPLSTARGVLFA